MRVPKLIIISCMAVLTAVVFGWAQGVPPSITEARVEPRSVRAGGKIRISCRVTHPAGPAFIERVAAGVFEADRNRVYPTLYDDGTHGDKTAADGVYSLVIRASEVPGESKVAFQAVSKDRVEVESDPIVLMVK